MNWRCRFYGHEWHHFTQDGKWGERCRRCGHIAYLWGRL